MAQAAAQPDMWRAVLSHEVTRDDIDDAMIRCELQLMNVVPATADVPAQLIYTSAQGVHIYLIEDARLGVLYVATTAAAGRALLARLRDELPTVEETALGMLPALLSAGAADVATVRQGLAALVLEEPTSPRTMDALQRALASPDPALRAAALISVTYAPTRALYAALARIRDEDDDLELRARAGHLLNAILQR